MATHAGLQFAVEHPEEVKEWEKASNSLVCLQVKNEAELRAFFDLSWIFDWFNPTVFVEPDINSEHTAFACLLDSEQARIFKRLSLSLSDKTDPRWLREYTLRMTSPLEGGEV